MKDRETTRGWEKVAALLSEAHEQYDSEKISQLEHALQAADLARKAHAPQAEIIAALLHDIGHMIAPAGPVGVEDHDKIGAHFLKEIGFGPSIVSLVHGHVDAKRYLVWRDSDYEKHLSGASRISLELQGGMMSNSEAKSFSDQESFRAKIRLRSWDDRAKIENLVVPQLEDYRTMVISQLKTRS